VTAHLTLSRLPFVRLRSCYNSGIIARVILVFSGVLVALLIGPLMFLRSGFLSGLDVFNLHPKARRQRMEPVADLVSRLIGHGMLLRGLASPTTQRALRVGIATEKIPAAAWEAKVGSAWNLRVL
jgi:hypothetical protein